MNSRTTLIELMHSHPVITLYEAQFSMHIRIYESFEEVHFKFYYTKQASEIDLLVDGVDTEGIPDGAKIGKAVVFSEAISIKQFTESSEVHMCSYYVRLFNNALTQFKIEEVGEV